MIKYLFKTNPYIFSSLDKVKELMLFRVSFFSLIFGIPLIFINISFCKKFDLYIWTYIQPFSILFVLWVLVFFKTMSFGRKVFLLIFAYYLTAVFNLYLTGFTGAGIPFIIASSILAIFFLDSRSSFFVIIFQFVTLLFIGLMYSFNVFELRLDIVSSNSNMISWILAISIITFQTLIYWNTFSVINKSFHSNLQISSNQQKELEIYNEKLKTLLDKQNKIQQELKLAKNKAEGSSRFKTMFLRNISHEIRTPLNAIIGLSNLIINKEIDEENRKKLCSVILDNGFKLEQIIDNIIEIAEFESDSAEISKSEIELKSFFNELFNVFRIKIDLSKVRFEYKINSKYSYIYLDKNKLFGIFKHLIQNAIDYTKEGSIEYGITEGKEIFCFFVKSSAAEIDEDKINKIINSDSSGINKIDLNHDQLSFGLTIVKMLSEKLGASIKVVSDNERTLEFQICLNKINSIRP